MEQQIASTQDVYQLIKQILLVFFQNLTTKVAFWVLFFLLSGSPIYAQTNLEFKHIQEKDGLSNNLVNCFLKDKNGFLWIGTFDGLNRFDGNNFAYFKKNRKDSNSIMSNVIQDLAQDKEGNIWYATPIGIGYYHQKTGSFKNFKWAVNREIGYTHNIICDRAGDIWFSVPDALFRYSTKNKTFELFTNDSTKKTTILQATISANGLVEDPHKDGIWMTSSKGLMYLDSKTKEFFHHKNNPGNLPFFKENKTSAISIGKLNQVVFGSAYDELTLFDLTTLQLLRKIQLKVKFDGQLSTTFIDAQNNIWISSWTYTTFFIDGKTFQPTELSHSEADKGSIAGNFFWATYQDTDGTVMLGTVNGISYFNQERAFYRIHKISQQLPNLELNEGLQSFTEDENGCWWIGSEFDGLIRYNPVSGKIDRYPLATTIKTVKIHKNQLLLGCTGGLFSFDLKKKSFHQIKLPPQVINNSSEIIEVDIQNDSTIWLSGGGNYVIKYLPQYNKMIAYDVISNTIVEKLPRNLPRVSFDNNNEIWVSLGKGGLLKFSKTEQKFIQIKSLENNDFETNFNKLKIDKNNYFWIPAGGYGLLKYQPEINKFKLFSESEGLVFDLVSSLHFDNFGYIWICAYNKFSIFNPLKESFQNFTMPLNEANYSYENSLFPLKNGHIISTMKGMLVEFLPEKIHQNSFQEKPIINFINSKNKHQNIINEDAKVVMGVEDNSFSIQFGMLPLPNINRYQFSYKLEGFDKDWTIPNVADKISYTNLPGGEYVFKVKAVKGGAESKISQVNIHIDTVFYKTIGFLCFVIVGILSLIYSFYRFRINQSARFHLMQMHTSALEKDKTEIQYQNLINHLNPHFLFNSLTSLNSLITISPAKASTFLEKLSMIYRYILQNKEKEWVTLEQELSFVQHYIDLQKSRFEEGLQINIDIPAIYYSKNIVPVTIQNLIENAIKHNIIDDESPLCINMYVKDECLWIVNNLQKKQFVETSNKQGLESLQNLYKYLAAKPLEAIETNSKFIVKVPFF